MRVDVDAPLQAEWMSGRTALVTGGGGREGGPGTVGWAVSRLMARHGASVAVLDREPRAAERTVSQIERAGGRAVVVLADAFNDEECARAVARAHGALGGLDTLVNNVAAWSPAELFDVDPEQFDELITANPVAAREPRRKMTALGTEGDCWDAAAAVLFLASDHARWISGQVLSVDGGGPPRPPYPGMSRTSTTAGARS